MIKKVHDVLIYQRTYHKDIATRFSLREGFEDLVFTSKTNNSINAANIKDSINYRFDSYRKRSILSGNERKIIAIFCCFSANRKQQMRFLLGKYQA